MEMIPFISAASFSSESAVSSSIYLFTYTSDQVFLTCHCQAVKDNKYSTTSCFICLWLITLWCLCCLFLAQDRKQ